MCTIYSCQHKGLSVCICVCISHIHTQGLSDLDTAVTYYKEVLKYDSTCVEAIACIATHHFYSDQPEIALRFYRYVRVSE